MEFLAVHRFPLLRFTCFLQLYR